MNSLAALICASIASSVLSACAPSEFWVNFYDSDDQMVISYSTSCSAASQVYYGLSASSQPNLVTGNSTTYTFNSYTSPYLHKVLLSGLPNDTPIYYYVGDSTSGYSDVMNFTSHPGYELKPSSFFAMVGDLGTTTNSVDTLDHIAAAPLSKFVAMVFPGDLSYADGTETVWDTFQTQCSPYSQSLPWMTLPGNHEQERAKSGGQSSFIAYQTRWSMPQDSSSSGTMYYSFKAAGVHFVMLNSYTAFDSSSPQYAWLEQEFASVNRTLTPWLVVQMHAPTYNSNNAHLHDGDAMRTAMEDLFYNAKVDVLFAGHVHAYERSYRTYQGQPDPSGPYYITVGDGGNREGLASSWVTPQPSWSAFRQASYGHGELEVVNATHLHWTWHQNPDLEPTIADELWIEKGAAVDAAAKTMEPVFRRI